MRTTHRRLNTLGVVTHLSDSTATATNLDPLDTIKQLEPTSSSGLSQWDRRCPTCLLNREPPRPPGTHPLRSVNLIENVHGPCPDPGLSDGFPLPPQLLERSSARTKWSGHGRRRCSPANSASQYVVTGHPKL